MDTQPTVEQQLLAHAERQTKALESLNTYFLRLFAALTLIAFIALIAWMSS